MRPYEAKAREASLAADAAAERAQQLTEREPKVLDWIAHPVRSWREAGEAHEARQAARQAEAKAERAADEIERRQEMLRRPDASTKRALSRAEQEVAAELDKLTADVEDRSQERETAEHEADQERQRQQQLEEQLAREHREEWQRQAEELMEQQRQMAAEMGLEIGDLDDQANEDDGPAMEM